MKNLKRILLMTLAAGMLGIFTTSAMAQSQEKRRKAVKTFNKARTLAKNGKYDESISVYKQAMNDAQEAEKAGQKGKDIVQLTQKKLPGIYFNRAVESYKAFRSNQSMKNLDAAIQSFQDAADAGKKYGSQSTVERSTGNITKLMYEKSSLQFDSKNYDDALTTINDVINRNANYALAYYQKGLILKKQKGNFDRAIAMFAKAIKVAEKNNNTSVARTAKQKAAEELTYRGSKQVEAKHYSSGIKTLNRALTYDAKSSDAEFRLAQAYNERGDFNNAITHAQKALNYEKGGRSAKAKIYFELGNAYQGKGQVSNACKYYGRAAYGQFKEKADYAMKEQLKCKSK